MPCLSHTSLLSAALLQLQSDYEARTLQLLAVSGVRHDTDTHVRVEFDVFDSSDNLSSGYICPLYMIDSLERLGVNHHFKEEIRSVLDEIFRYWIQGVENIFLDPTTCAMAFRMLRLNGYDVSSDPFYQYSEDKFAESLKGYLKDVGAVIELYRASQAIIHPDESIFVRQSLWTKHLLKQESSPYRLYADKLRRYVDLEVKDVLNFPYHANLERLLNRRSMEHYNAVETRILRTSYRLASANLANQKILKLAVEDFNICQSIHIEELKQLSRTSMERAGHTGSSVLPFCEYTLGVANASCLCFWIGSLFGYCYPHCYWNLQQKKHIWLIEFGSGRGENGVLTTVDDFFDVGGSEEEQVDLIQLVEKWDVDINTVCCSETVTIIFSSIHSTVCEIGEKSVNWQGHNVKNNVIKIWLNLIQSIYREAEWLRTKTVPTIDDYMQNAYISFALGPIILPALYLVGPKLSDEDAENHELNSLYKLRESEEGKLNVLPLHIAHGNGIITEEDAMEEMTGSINVKDASL
ncbi:Ent-kaur-16-ene synthase, chloroplastic isoform A [Glycine soja]|uniref:Ent-kaur-16-ene synthase, chloroplastic isoform A n=1 Tax=Glycine soja TaxID=3848 RepID=A0A445GYN5_GLYSO|nr:Ent-kaur-16-ene synthase, chloroplastic isoform A [Glycine soja]